MENKHETVLLEIEETAVECDKDVLVQNSDYFAAMFAGGFRESSLKKIKIQGVDLKSFNTILLLLWDKTYVIPDEDINLILQAACMLQFNVIKQLCEFRILEVLKPSICLKIWKTAELLDITPLWLKAKYMALEDFSSVCDSSHILELSIEDICLYLGHIYLNVKSELSVFQTAMNWWYENQELYDREDRTKVLLRLLNCIDFSVLRENEIKEIQSYPDIADNEDIISVLNCVIDLKANGISVGSDFSENNLACAIHLCNAKSRKRSQVPCVLLQSDWTFSPCPKKMKCSEANDRSVVIYDKFLRKRILLKVSTCSPRAKLFYNADLSPMLYDAPSDEFRNTFLIGGDKVRDLEGFKVLSYKEFVFVYGGEYLIGAGNWNCNFWTYNTIKEKWERRNVLPQGRRHFETLILDDCVYIIGGVGKFRVIQENMLWYDFKTDKWSHPVKLPGEERLFKCCTFNEQVFLVCMGGRRAYFFNKELEVWRTINIIVDKEIVDEIADFAVFSDANYFYIKGKTLIKFKLDGENLVPVKQTVIKCAEYEEIEAVLCNDIVYTLYRGFDEHYNVFYAFESFNLDTGQQRYVFEKKIQGKDTLEVDNKLFCPTQYTKLFSFNYYCLIKEDLCVNNPFG